MGEAKRRKLNGYVHSNLLIPNDRELNVMALRYAAEYGDACGDDSTRLMFMTEIRKLIKLAFQCEGWEAFRSTKELAAAHDAGHVVVLGLYGKCAKKCHIESRHIPQYDYTEWGGLTVHHDHFWGVSPTTSPENDWCLAAQTIAGWTGEHIYDKTLRTGSSIDEVARFRMICTAITDKIGSSFEDFIKTGLRFVEYHLETYKSIHFEISAALIDRMQLEASEIASIMEPIYNGIIPDYASDFIAHFTPDWKRQYLV